MKDTFQNLQFKFLYRNKLIGIYRLRYRDLNLMSLQTKNFLLYFCICVLGYKYEHRDIFSDKWRENVVDK